MTTLKTMSRVVFEHTGPRSPLIVMLSTFAELKKLVLRDRFSERTSAAVVGLFDDNVIGLHCDTVLSPSSLLA